MRMSLSRLNGLLGDPGADTIHGRGQREHVTCDTVSCQYYYCEAQGKGRAKGRPRKVTQRSFIDGGWWMVDILSLMLYTKFGCHPPPPPPPPPPSTRTSLYLQD